MVGRTGGARAPKRKRVEDVSILTRLKRFCLSRGKEPVYVDGGRGEGGHDVGKDSEAATEFPVEDMCVEAPVEREVMADVGRIARLSLISL